MAGIASEARETLGIRGEFGNSGINHPACAFHQPGQLRMSARLPRRVEYEA
jgi:hypothetical protein